MATDFVTPVVPPLPSVRTQVERLRALGITVDLDQLDQLDQLGQSGSPDGTLVALAPGALAVHDLAALLTYRGKPGFVVEDMTDVESFGPTVELPEDGAYLVTGLDRGDELLGWRPAEALPALERRERSPLTLHEGLSWVLQTPEVLADNHCFMTIGSRKPTAAGYDARTPAIWISRGTGRDGSERRNAPKVGWCWWNNKHTWLGFASCTARVSS